MGADKKILLARLVKAEKVNFCNLKTQDEAMFKRP